MSASDLVLAAALLSAPVGTPEQAPAGERWESVRAAIHKTAVAWEIMDPREERYLLAARDDFETDLNLLRQRFAELPTRRSSPTAAGCPTARR